jgi:hypothetical protein
LQAGANLFIEGYGVQSVSDDYERLSAIVIRWSKSFTG